MEKIKIVQVGIGGYGRTYLNAALPNLPNDRYEYVGVVDPIAEKAPLYEQVLEKKIPVYATIEEFYSHHQADLCIIAAPIGYHCHYSVYALEHGSNVLCEKPVAATLQEAYQMKQTAEKTGKFLAVGFQRSFSQATLAAKQDFLNGVFGKAKRFKVHVLWERGWDYFGRNNWAGKIRDRQGHWILDSVAHNATAHYLHNAYFLHGPALDKSAFPQSIQCELYRANAIENFDTCALRAVTDGGCEVDYYVTHAVHYNHFPVFEFEYEYATLTNQSSDPKKEGVMRALFRDGTCKEYGPSDPPRDTKFEAVLDAIDHGSPIPCGVEASIPHLLTINFLADSVPIYDFPGQYIVKDEDLRLTYVPGLEKTMLACYDQAKLPSELDVPWAKKAPVLSCADYREFSGQPCLDK